MTAHAVSAMGVSDASAAAYAVALHAMIIVPITLLGILLIVLSSRSRRRQTVNATVESAVDGRFGKGRGRVSAIPRQAA